MTLNEVHTSVDLNGSLRHAAFEKNLSIRTQFDLR